MPRIITTIGMSNRQLHNWRRRAQQGDAYELEGAFGDRVFLPKRASDIDPAGERQKNRLRLQQMKRIIEWNKSNRKSRYSKIRPVG